MDSVGRKRRPLRLKDSSLKVSYFNVRLPDDLVRAVKIAAVVDGMTLTEVATIALRTYLEDRNAGA
jgi:hypothetical protein